MNAMNTGDIGMSDSALVAMSGGVDSTVAAMLALRDGIECTGAVMKLHQHAQSNVDDATIAAERLGIPLCVFDFSESFEQRVITRFTDAYRSGRTPNPCIDCNRHIKFGLLMRKARELGISSLVTGHYARIERDGARFLLKKGADFSKDQSYVLYALAQEQLAHIRFPLGELTKQETRALATEAGFESAEKRESQDICFIPDGDYAKFITGHTGTESREGRFIDINGNDLGRNKGVMHYTIGQRRGMGLSMPYPAYVLELRPADGTVVVGENKMLFSKSLDVREINLIPFDKIDAPIRARVKIRYRHAEQQATVEQTGADTLHMEFDEPQRAITKGQAAVIYDGDVVIGGGTIE